MIWSATLAVGNWGWVVKLTVPFLIDAGHSVSGFEPSKSREILCEPSMSWAIVMRDGTAGLTLTPAVSSGQVISLVGHKVIPQPLDQLKYLLTSRNICYI